MKNQYSSRTENAKMPLIGRGLVARVVCWFFFAILLGVTIFRHEMWSDELQAFLIARDSHSLADLLNNLHYEGHPALWHLLLLIPSHISWNPAGMQVLNFLLALIEAWLILLSAKSSSSFACCSFSHSRFFIPMGLLHVVICWLFCF